MRDVGGSSSLWQRGAHVETNLSRRDRSPDELCGLCGVWRGVEKDEVVKAVSNVLDSPSSCMDLPEEASGTQLILQDLAQR